LGQKIHCRIDFGKCGELNRKPAYWKNEAMTQVSLKLAENYKEYGGGWQNFGL
jgi:hypothetical protein